MSTITTKDGTTLYYKDWGEGPAITFSHGWPLNADAWDGQMLFLIPQLGAAGAQSGLAGEARARRRSPGAYWAHAARFGTTRAAAGDQPGRCGPHPDPRLPGPHPGPAAG